MGAQSFGAQSPFQSLENLPIRSALALGPMTQQMGRGEGQPDSGMGTAPRLQGIETGIPSRIAARAEPALRNPRMPPTSRSPAP